MTLCAFGANTPRKRLNMAAILKLKLAPEEPLEKIESTQNLLTGAYKGKKHWFNPTPPNEADVGNNHSELGLTDVQQGQNLSNSLWWPKMTYGTYSIRLKT